MAKTIPSSATSVTDLNQGQAALIQAVYGPGNGLVANGSFPLPSVKTPLSANGHLIVDDGMLIDGKKRAVSEDISGASVSVDSILEGAALPWYVTAEEEVYGLGVERSLEAYYEFAGVNPYTYAVTKDWCFTFA
eukprot:GDKK01023914.1.p1 GENE.GDKK01023914.1~~GDKK01023914.1.p1  ORF type:complete len:134 (-),score=0.01 GDKK01023914.1:50-451(-)